MGHARLCRPRPVGQPGADRPAAGRSVLTPEPTEPTRHTFQSDDGLTLVYHEVGSGRPVLLLHGYISAGRDNWLRSGAGDRLLADGRRLIMPDMRGHGESAKPHDPSLYPPDALIRDLQTLIAELGLTDYDLGAYSLGARIAARLMALGARPRRAVLGGTGLDPIVHAEGRGASYRRLFARLGTFEPGTPEAQMEEHLKSIDADPVALGHIFHTFVNTPREALASVQVPTLVIAGEDDTERGSVEELAAVLAHGQVQRIPGDHLSALLGTEFRDALAGFLAEHDLR